MTPWHKRITPVGRAMREIALSFWYLRTVILLLALGVLTSAAGVWLLEHNLPELQGRRPPRSIPEALYLCTATALSLDTGSLTALTSGGTLLLFADALVGFCLLGIVVWVLEHCLEEVGLEESRAILLSSRRKASLR